MKGTKQGTVQGYMEVVGQHNRLMIDSVVQKYRKKMTTWVSRFGLPHVRNISSSEGYKSPK